MEDGELCAISRGGGRGPTATDNNAHTIYPWSDQTPAGNLQVSKCKCSWKAKRLEVVAPAAAKNRTNREDIQGVVNRLKFGDCEQSNIGETGITACVKEYASYVKNGQFDMSAAAEHAIFEQRALDFDNVEVW